MDDSRQNDPSLSFDEFPAVSWDEWQRAAVASLKGRPFDKLISPTDEGIDIQPLYRREDTADIAATCTVPGSPPYVRGTSASGYLERPWAIAQELGYGSPAVFNLALRYDLERGQTAVNLLPDGPTRAGKDPDHVQSGEVGRGGVSLATVADVAEALDGVDLGTPVYARAGTAALPLLALLVAHVRQTGRAASELRGCLEADPLGDLAREGSIPLSLERAYDEIAQLTQWAEGHAPRLATMAVHTYPYHDAGASAVQELAFALATGVAYLRALSRRGVAIDMAARNLRFDFAVGSNFFMEVAKLRAARLLWSQVVEAFGGDADAQKMQIHGRTARRNKTAVDAHTNMLRVTTEALAAAVGGVESLHVAPYDEPARPPDEFSRRIARNVQIILREEAHLAQVIDPAGGSWAVETLTDQLAREAWALFQTIEHRGGMAEALKDGYANNEVERVAEERASRLATRRDVLVGVNQFANPTEAPASADEFDYVSFHDVRTSQVKQYRANHSAAAVALQQLGEAATNAPVTVVEAAIAAAEAGATLGELTHALRMNDGARPVVTPLPSSRAAEPFEALRRRADAYAEAHGQRPRIFLANMGPPKQHKARADFAQGFFEAGGFQVLTTNGFPTSEAAAAAALESGAPAVVICSTDETYPELVPPLVKAIRRKARDVTVVLAGRPADQVEALRKAGVDEFIYLGADCLAMNEWLIGAIQ